MAKVAKVFKNHRLTGKVGSVTTGSYDVFQGENYVDTITVQVTRQGKITRQSSEGRSLRGRMSFEEKAPLEALVEGDTTGWELSTDLQEETVQDGFNVRLFDAPTEPNETNSVDTTPPVL